MGRRSATVAGARGVNLRRPSAVLGCAAGAAGALVWVLGAIVSSREGESVGVAIDRVVLSKHRWLHARGRRRSIRRAGGVLKSRDLKSLLRNLQAYCSSSRSFEMGIYVRLMSSDGILGEELRPVPIPIFREPSWRQPSTAKAGWRARIWESVARLVSSDGSNLWATMFCEYTEVYRGYQEIRRSTGRRSVFTIEGNFGSQ